MLEIDWPALKIDVIATQQRGQDRGGVCGCCVDGSGGRGAMESAAEGVLHVLENPRV